MSRGRPRRFARATASGDAQPSSSMRESTQRWRSSTRSGWRTGDRRFGPWIIAASIAASPRSRRAAGLPKNARAAVPRP